MTIWDNIYKKHQDGYPAWTTFKGEMLSQFVKFVESNKFTTKSALDIGCGTGKYLAFLKKSGFKIVGIDASETAIQMAKQALGSEADIICTDMFSFEIPANKYDLIFSILALHHGYKEQIEAIIKKIHESLIEGGRIFITLADLEGSRALGRLNRYEELKSGTYTPLSEPERGVPHSFFTREEMIKLFFLFKEVKIEPLETSEEFPRDQVITATK